MHQHYVCYKILMVNSNILNLNTLTYVSKVMAKVQARCRLQVIIFLSLAVPRVSGMEDKQMEIISIIKEKKTYYTKLITLCSILSLLFYFLLTCVYPNNTCQKQHKDKSKILQEKQVELLSLNTESLTPI